MACCCKINCKGFFGIILSNVGFALLLASFLTCSWLTRPLGSADDSTSPTASTNNAVYFAIIRDTSSDNSTTPVISSDNSTTPVISTATRAISATTTVISMTTDSSTKSADEDVLSGVINCLPESIKPNQDEFDDSDFTKYITYVATIASLIAALSLLVLGDIFLSVYCSFCCCCTCGIITAGGLHIAGSLFNFLGCGIFTYGIIKWNDYQGGSPSAGDFGWSFYVAWISGLIIFISGLLETQGINADDYTSASSHQAKKQPANVAYQPRATMNPAYAAYDF